MEGKLIVFSSPSGAGKTTIVRRLLQKILNLEFSISACTRAIRPGEQDGRDYYFLSTKEFEEKIKNNEFIEWEEVYKGSYYGTLKSEAERIWQKGSHVIFDIDVKGAINIKKKYADRALTIFIKAPSLKAIEERLKGRETEDKKSLAERLERAKFELSCEDQFDKVILNDDLEKAVQEALDAVNGFIN